MSIVLSLHTTPAYDSENPLSNGNLYFQDPDGNVLTSAVELSLGTSYGVYAHVANTGDDTERRATVEFYYSTSNITNTTEATLLGSQRSRVEPSSVNPDGVTFFSPVPFSPTEEQTYYVFAVVSSPNDPIDYSMQPIDPADRHVAGQTVAVAAVKKEVDVTLHYGDTNNRYQGHNPNIFLEDDEGNIYNTPAGKQIGISRDDEYYLKARVYNRKKDASPCKVYFYEHGAGLTQNLKSPIAESEEVVIGGESIHIYTSTTKYKYHKSNRNTCLVAVCTSPDDELKGIGTNKSVQATDDNVAQHNVHVDGSITIIDTPVTKTMYVPQLQSKSFSIKRLSSDEHIHEDLKSRNEAPTLEDIKVGGKSYQHDLDTIAETGILIDAKQLMDQTIEIEFTFSKNTKKGDVAIYSAFAPEGGVQFVFDFDDLK